MAPTETVPAGILVDLHVWVYNDNDDRKRIEVWVWLPNKILDEDRHKPFTRYGGTYLDCVEALDWDNQQAALMSMVSAGWTMTGDIEINDMEEDVPLTDERIKIAFSKPLATPAVYEIRC